MGSLLEEILGEDVVLKTQHNSRRCRKTKNKKKGSRCKQGGGSAPGAPQVKKKHDPHHGKSALFHPSSVQIVPTTLLLT
jgi:hypothetical protein